MNIAPVSFTKASATSFKGQGEKPCEGKCENDIAAAIDRNTEALEKLAYQVKVNSYVQYAIEKTKSGTKGLHQNAYGNTTSPEELINYVNRYWEKPSNWY